MISDKNRQNLSKHYLIAYGIITFFAVFLFTMYGRFDKEVTVTGDAVKYIQMTTKTFSAVENPFGLRLLSPYLAKIFTTHFHFSMNAAWLTLTFTFCLISIFLFFMLLYKIFKLKFSWSLIFSLLLLFTYSFVGFNLFDFWLVDPLANLLFILALMFLFDKKYLWFLAVITVGFINKETALLLLPAYPIAIYCKNRKIDKELIISIISSLVIVFLYLIYRHWVIDRIGGDTPYVMFTGAENRNRVEAVRFALSINKDVFVIYNVFGFFWLIYAYCVYMIYKEGIYKQITAISIYLLIALLFCRFFVTDTDRAFAIFSPLLFLSLALYFNKIDDNQVKRWFFISFFLYAAIQLRWLGRSESILTGLLMVSIFLFWIEQHRQDRILSAKGKREMVVD